MLIKSLFLSHSNLRFENREIKLFDVKSYIKWINVQYIALHEIYELSKAI